MAEAIQIEGRPPKIGVGAAVDVLSQSTGSVVVDAALGAAIGYWVGRGKTSYVIGGAVATGLAGVLGAALTVGVGYWRGRL